MGKHYTTSCDFQKVTLNERITTLDTLDDFVVIDISNPTKEKALDIRSQEKEKTTPSELIWLKNNSELDLIDLLWLEKHYQLDLKSVETMKFDGRLFSLKFKPDSYLAICSFIAIVREAGCDPLYNESFSTVSLGINERKKMIKGTKYVKAFVPLIKDAAEVEDLKTPINLIKKFIRIFPFAASYKRYEDSYNHFSSGRARHVSHGEHYQEDNTEIERFLEEIKPSLPLLKEILLNDEYQEDQKKLQYYFFYEKNLILRLQNFVEKKEKLRFQTLLMISVGMSLP
jgi:hypothetical protein